MSEEGQSSSAYTIESAVLKPYMSPNSDVGNTPANSPQEDIGPLITGVQIHQSLNDMSYFAKIKIEDNSNLLETLPLRSEETLELSLKTKDTEEILNLKLFVYNIDAIGFNGQMSGSNYTLNCVSHTTFQASKNRIVAPWKGTIAEAAAFFFNNFFGKANEGESEGLPYKAKRYDLIDEPERFFIVQNTEGVVDCIIPNHEPTAAMNFLAARAYNPNTPSQTFRFFETTQGYWFVTDEYFFKQPKEDVLNLFYAVETEQGDPELDAKRIDKLIIISRGSNSSDHLYSGAYSNRIVELDLVRGVMTTSHYDYLKDTKFVDSDGEIVDPENSPHTEEFIKDTFTRKNAKDMILFKDYAGVGDIPGSIKGETFFSTIAQNRIAYHHHLNDVQLSIETKGRADIIPGKIIDLNIQMASLESGAELNPQLNGRYLVTDTVQTFALGKLTTSAKIKKLNWSATDLEQKVEDVSE